MGAKIAVLSNDLFDEVGNRAIKKPLKKELFCFLNQELISAYARHPNRDHAHHDHRLSDINLLSHGNCRAVQKGFW